MASNFIDAHVHVWAPNTDRFPHTKTSGARSGSPASFTPEQLIHIAEPLGVKRIVLIQMSSYGTDNSYMLSAIRRHLPVFSGVAIVDPAKPGLGEEMTRLRSLGVRGFRVMRGTPDHSGPDWIESGGAREMWRLAAEKQMAICPLMDADAIPSVDRMCQSFPGTTVVIDHMARIGHDGIVRAEDIRALCGLARHARVNVKISAFYALGEKRYPYLDLVPLIRALHEAYGPRRLMWGTDSPFQVEAPHSYAGSLELVRDRLDFLGPEDRDWLLRKAAERIFF